MISVVIVLAYDELNHQRNVFTLFSAQNPLGLLVVLVPFFSDETIDLVEVITDLVLKVHSNCFNFVTNCILLGDSRHLRDIQIFGRQSFLFLEHYFLRMLAFDASLHISQQQAITLLFKGFLFLKHASVMAFLLGDNLVVASLVLSIALRVEVVFLQGNSFRDDVAIFGRILRMFMLLLEKN